VWKPDDARGMPKHPHRGYEMLTLVLDGELSQRDVRGRGETLRAGDASWIVAGAGLVHAEMPTDALRHHGGRFHAVQVWVNLRAADKRAAPSISVARAAEIPIVTDYGGSVRVLSGSLLGVTGPLRGHTPVVIACATVPPGKRLDALLPHDHVGAVYVLEGSITAGADAAPVRATELAQLRNDGDTLHLVAGDAGATALVLAGVPLLERIYWHGPFVMSSPDEIGAAITDFYTDRLMRAP
jgi:redox-sensitive bicupin YhaK (pirin superfamily)